MTRIPPLPRRRAAVLGALALSLVFLAGAGRATAQATTLPAPESVLGFPVGADFKLARYEEAVAYFQRLDAASDHLQLLDVGRTSLGRPWYVAVISTPANLARLEHYRDIAQRLAHPDGLTDAEARRLAREGRAFVDINGGLHASEVAGAQHTIQLAYDLLSRRDDPKIRAILDNTVLFLWPSLNPDGQDIVVDWYREVVGTPYEVAPLHELYQKYIGHDNNRDAYMLNVPESRVVARTWRHWEPQIVYVHHQTAPFPTRIWLPPFAEPIAPRVPGLMSREVNTIGMTIAQALESNGQVGATHMGTGFDAWYPGYIDYLPMLQNVASFWTETALYRYATPHFYTTSDFPADMRDLRPQSLYASPWPGGWWRLRDAVDYMRTASVAVLDYATKYREELLYNRYQAGRDAIARYRAGPPYAYLVPQAQRDPGTAAALLRRLAFNGVRVAALEHDAAFEGVTYPRGTWVIPMDQEFAELVRQLFEPQEYPDLRDSPDGPLEQPYDAAGWTLPMQMDVRVIEARAPLPDAFRAAMRPVRGTPVDWHTAEGAPFATDSVAAGIAPPPQRITGSGDQLAVDPAQNDAFRLIGRALAAGGAVRYAPGRGEGGARYLVSGVPGERLDGWARELALRAERRERAAGSAAVRARIAVYRPWTGSMDEGWLEWLLDGHELPYTVLTNADVRAGDLGARFDVIFLASDSPRTIAEGYAEGMVPPRYAGGLGEEGARTLDAFVRAGGTLVALNRSADYAIDALQLPVRDVVGELPRKDFFTGGSLLAVTTDPAHPVMAGMPARATVFVDDSPVFTTLDGFEGAALATYASTGSPLRSGYLLGERHLQGHAAALDVRHGGGHVVLIGFRPQWRGQPFGTFRVVFNAALFGGEVAARAAGTPGFWSAPDASERVDPAARPLPDGTASREPPSGPR
ncbi:MAG TPA: M14 metallopeptidase family protein [Gemmatimonadaceae bacterium]|nr:M14 metallopeptidase family protein [Gemmatimonadaceae bacterium]